MRILDKINMLICKLIIAQELDLYVIVTCGFNLKKHHVTPNI